MIHSYICRERPSKMPAGSNVSTGVARAAPGGYCGAAPVGSQCLGAQTASQESSAMPHWMLGGAGSARVGGGSVGDDVASQLAAMWGQQAAGKAWATQAQILKSNA